MLNTCHEEDIFSALCYLKDEQTTNVCTITLEIWKMYVLFENTFVIQCSQFKGEKYMNFCEIECLIIELV